MICLHAAIKNIVVVIITQNFADTFQYVKFKSDLLYERTPIMLFFLFQNYLYIYIYVKKINFLNSSLVSGETWKMWFKIPKGKQWFYAF